MVFAPLAAATSACSPMLPRGSKAGPAWPTRNLGGTLAEVRRAVENKNAAAGLSPSMRLFILFALALQPFRFSGTLDIFRSLFHFAYVSQLSESATYSRRDFLMKTAFATA